MCIRDRLGLSLDESAQIILMYDSPGNNRRQLEALVGKIQEKQAEFKRQRQDLEAVLKELREAESKCLAALDQLNHTQGA